MEFINFYLTFYYDILFVKILSILDKNKIDYTEN